MSTAYQTVAGFYERMKTGDKVIFDYLLRDCICVICVICGWFELRGSGLKRFLNGPKSGGNTRNPLYVVVDDLFLAICSGARFLGHTCYLGETKACRAAISTLWLGLHAQADLLKILFRTSFTHGLRIRIYPPRCPRRARSRGQAVATPHPHRRAPSHQARWFSRPL